MNAVPLQNCILFLYREIQAAARHADIPVVQALRRYSQIS
jgi:hypothetical protein